MLGMHQYRLDAGALQGLEDDLPIDARGLHHGGADLVLKQPTGQLAQPAGQGAERAGMGLGLGVGPGPAHAGGDLHFVHIQAGGAGMDDVQGISVYTIRHNASSEWVVL